MKETHKDWLTEIQKDILEVDSKSSLIIFEIFGYQSKR